jgi:hypothetical protein
LILELRNKVIKGENGTDEVKWRIDGVGQVVSETVVLGLGWNGDPFPLREIRGVKLLLLWDIRL